jgi:hypothetical protein
MWSNSNSFSAGNGNSLSTEDRRVRSLPWIFRVGIPGFQAGWPA